MNGFKQFLRNHACFATEDSSGGGAPEAEALEAPTETEASPAESATLEPEAKELDTKPEPEKEPWQKVRFAELTRQRHEAERRAELAERRYAEAQARLKPPADPNVVQPPGEKLYTKADLEREATQRAETIAQQRMQNAALERIKGAGESEYTPAAFNAACNTLADLGANDKPEFLALVTDLPNGHEVLHRLGNDPDEAMRILRMPPLKMAAAIGQYSAKPATPKPAAPAPAPKPVSKAPEPISPIRGSGSVVETDPDKMTSEQYYKWRGYK